MSLKIAHISDLHFYHPPTLREAAGKRMLGLANLYVKGRIDHFSADVAKQAIKEIVALQPDAVALTGDLTALASKKEFELARQALTPLVDALPTYIIPGNHDYYTPGAHRSARIEEHFSPWLRGDGNASDGPIQYPTHHRQGNVRFFGLNPCRATVGSSGLLDEAQLLRLRALLAEERGEGEFRVLMIHYPILGWQGQEITKWSRRLNNRQGLLDVLGHNPVDLILHGHDHLRYHNRLNFADHTTYVCNAGSAAFAPRPDCPIPASFNIYTVDGSTLAGVAHYDLGPEGFFKAYEGDIPPVGPTFDRAAIGEIHAY